MVLQFKDNSFETIIDKGGLDALMGEEDKEAEKAGGKLLREVCLTHNAFTIHLYFGHWDFQYN